ncbi:MAG: putative sulfate exporter family transporter [Tardiphaga sp.]|uniref:YeiH family protein n=1 Tax=Tardiphaga sp. TaxID=1926292 RepID=UPI0019A8E7A3|nr:putative sulfate exporter family transporter [Tardiphaga sp.]MBC7585996.1 putative sulfate exporter family transporter [Tardiphaga sp.]
MTPLRLAVLPGLALCIGVALLSMALERAEVALVGEPYLEALVLAILIGVLIRTPWSPGPRWLPGIDFSAKVLLEIAVVMLGAALSVHTVLALGPFLLVGIVVVVIFAIASSYAICRALKLRQKMAILIACGNSICGNSAIAAVAPIIGADSDDVASSIAFTAVLGVVVVLLLPLLVPLLQLSLTQYGVLAGLTVYAVPQVLAATLPIGALSNQVGTVVKLVRVLMLGPVVFVLSLTARHLHDGKDPSRKPPKLALHQLLPWFIVGFLLIATVRSLGLIPTTLIKPIASVASVLTTISMAGLGLGVDVRVVAKAGLPVTIAVTLSLIVLAVISYGVILAAGVA